MAQTAQFIVYVMSHFHTIILNWLIQKEGVASRLNYGVSFKR